MLPDGTAENQTAEPPPAAKLTGADIAGRIILILLLVLGFGMIFVFIAGYLMLRQVQTGL